MNELNEKIYAIHGKMSSLEADFKNMDKKLDTALSSKRRCNGLRKVEMVLLSLTLLVTIILITNPSTKAVANVLIKAIF